MQAVTVKISVGTQVVRNAHGVANLARVYPVPTPPTGFLTLPVQLSRAESVAQDLVLEILFQTKSFV